MESDRKVRTTVSIPRELLRRAEELARRSGINSRSELFQCALRRYAREQETIAFEKSLGDSAGDPDLARVDEQIDKEFDAALTDGLDPGEDFSDYATQSKEE
ncbi:ribbon-helix-helix protein, CopG family [bacterium]|nr:ribbon-helix-helix protein, CopG family [bacterium]